MHALESSLNADLYSILIEHPKDIPEPDIATAQADVFFELLDIQPVSLELSFMRTDIVNSDEK
jgi:vacuolar protein sorting-associated protein 13A/C